ncbi:MAG: ankyrin repeat domain-containing protein [Rubrivivax sp.]|nr:ankyrin repeat domain-containing protein [Rubrivivax sp.]
MLRIVRFLPLVMLVAFVAWCSASSDRRREAAPQRTELTELMLQQGLISTGSPRSEALADAARVAGPSGMNQLLHSVAAQASPEALRWIVAHGADPASVGAPQGVPLLQQAARQPSFVRMDYFLGLGLDARQRGPGGDTVLHVAARAGLDARVLQLLLSKGLKLTDVNDAGQTAVHVAALKSLGPLVQAGADVDAVDALGRSALHLAAAEKRADLVVELVRLRASVFKTDNRQRTPLHLAAQSRCEPCVDALLAADAPRSARDSDGLTARDLAQARRSNNSRYRDWTERL